MARGAKRKPSHLKVVAGTARPDRMNAAEPQFDAPVDLAAPAELDELARGKWNELAPILSGAGVIKATDLDNLAAFCRAYSRWRRAEEIVDQEGIVVVGGNGALQKNPALTAVNEALRQMAMFGSSLGLDPSSRQRVMGKMPEGGGNPFANL